MSVQRGADLVRLQRDEDVVLRLELIRPVRGAQLASKRAVGTHHARAMLANRGEMRTAADHADLNPLRARCAAM